MRISGSPNQVFENQKLNNKVVNNPELNPDSKAGEASPDTKDSSRVSNLKKGSANSSLSLETEEKKIVVMPLLATLAMVVAMLASARSSASYNPELFDAAHQQLKKCREFFDKYGQGADIDFMGNMSVSIPVDSETKA